MDYKCLHTKWLGLDIKSPCVLASITLMSNVNLNSHIEYYSKVIEKGIGAIVMPSVNPQKKKEAKENKSISDCIAIETGLKNNDKMGFTVLGSTDPNILPLQYGVHLSEALCSIDNRPLIIGSVANIGTEEEFIYAIKKLCKTNIDALEINFSCPNVKTKNDNVTNLTLELLKVVRSIVKIPISLKLTPYEDHSTLLESLNDEIDGVTLSNAYIGLLPPNIDNINNLSPFDRHIYWSPSGMYGPFEKMLTFYHLYKLREISNKKCWSIASVGGYVSYKDILQGIMLGADVVQLSSVIAWEGINIIENCNEKISQYLANNNFKDLTELKGIAISYIKQNSDSIGKYDKNHKVQIDYEKCRKCAHCFCCNRMCVAINQDIEKNVKIDYNLCSGCTWCYNQCPNNAIKIISC